MLLNGEDDESDEEQHYTEKNTVINNNTNSAKQDGKNLKGSKVEKDYVSASSISEKETSEKSMEKEHHDAVEDDDDFGDCMDEIEKADAHVKARLTSSSEKNQSTEGDSDNAITKIGKSCSDPGKSLPTNEEESFSTNQSERQPTSEKDETQTGTTSTLKNICALTEKIRLVEKAQDSIVSDLQKATSTLANTIDFDNITVEAKDGPKVSVQSMRDSIMLYKKKLVNIRATMRNITRQVGRMKVNSQKIQERIVSQLEEKERRRVLNVEKDQRLKAEFRGQSKDAITSQKEEDTAE
eukprot:g3184.t1